jgi:cytochrome c biogenesis protein CcmG/thiol:disulfide interchange protein DsbE
MAASETALENAPPAQPADAREPRPSKSEQFRTAVAGLALAVIIVAASIAMGSRLGWNTIGTGGINRQLLPKVGDVAPDFEAHDVFGNPVRLSQFRGHPVWLMFWGSWCPPCRAEFPDIQAAYAKLEPKGLRMLGVSLRESPLDAATYAARNGATFLVLSDPDESDTGAAYPIYNFPTHIFIDSNGIIRAIVLEDMSTDRAISEASRLLAEDSGTSEDTG